MEKINKTNKKQNNLTEKTFIGMMWIIIGKMGSFILQTSVTIILARLLSPTDYGTVSAALVIINFCDVFLIHTIPPVIIQKLNPDERYFESTRTFSLLLGCFLTIMCILLSESISRFFGINNLSLIIKVLSIVFIIESLSLVDDAYYQKKLLFKYISIRRLISYFIGYGVIGIILAINGFGTWSLIFAYITQSLVNYIFMRANRKITSKFGFDKNIFRELLNKSFGYTISRLGTFFALQGDNFIIGKFLGAESLGVYGKAYQFFSMPVSYIGEMFEKGLFSALSNCQDDRSKFNNYFLRLFTLNLLTILPISIYIFIYSSEIIIFLLGYDWIEAIGPFKILSIGIIFRIMYKMCESILKSLGYIYIKAFIECIYAASVIVGALIGVNNGLLTVCKFVLFAVIVNFIIIFISCKSVLRFSISELIKENSKALICGIFLLILLNCIKNISVIYIDIVFIRLLLGGVTFIILYIIIYFVLFKFKELDKVKYLFFNIIRKKV